LPENANPHPDRNRILEDAMKSSQNIKRLEALNAERYKEMTSDTDKLIALASILKADTNNSRKEPNPIEVVRTAELIEKLAHSVHDKMKATVSN